ncbi:hypothetical protein PO124_35205 [Bacillus licheniformis]|nr:hypothetical protein [Bacillus licheniformis]
MHTYQGNYSAYRREKNGYTKHACTNTKSSRSKRKNRVTDCHSSNWSQKAHRDSTNRDHSQKEGSLVLKNTTG